MLKVNRQTCNLEKSINWISAILILPYIELKALKIVKTDHLSLITFILPKDCKLFQIFNFLIRLSYIVVIICWMAIFHMDFPYVDLPIVYLFSLILLFSLVLLQGQVLTMETTQI